jgi:hypothetical protein
MLLPLWAKMLSFGTKLQNFSRRVFRHVLTGIVRHLPSESLMIMVTKVIKANSGNYPAIDRNAA